MTDIAAFIQTRLRLEPAPGLAPIKLYRAHAGSGLSQLSGDARSPYWAFLWAGGAVLARHVLANPSLVAGRTVLDLGTGGGVAAIAAALSGAARVIGADVDPLALTALSLNAAANGVGIEPWLGDMIDGEPSGADLILASDVFYDAGLAARMEPFLHRCQDAGIEVLIGDPGRASLPRERLQWVAEYEVADFAEIQPKAAGVYRLA